MHLGVTWLMLNILKHEGRSTAGVDENVISFAGVNQIPARPNLKF